MTPLQLSRRQLFAATGGALVLAACGDDKKDSSSTEQESVGQFIIVQRFPNHPLFTPGEVRLPISLADASGTLGDGPETLTGWIEDSTSARIVELSVPRRAVGIEIPYWEVRATLDAVGIYTMRFEGDDGFGASFQVFDAAEVSSPVTGTKLPGFDTPTIDDHRGVEPYCSLTPEPCPLHSITLNEALAAGLPVVYMVGTPAHCSTGTCAPGLEFLVAEHERMGASVAMVHADVYADDAATTVAPAVVALNVLYEPIIYLCDSEGTIVDRLDGIWDASELTERIDLLVS